MSATRRATRSWPSSPTSSRWGFARTSRSGRTRPGSTTRCCAPRTGRSTSCGAGTISFYVDVADITLHELDWPAGRRMLDVMIDAGLAASYSCREGVCGACACRLTGGEVEMAHNEEDLADGYVLACQSVALTPEVSVTYDQPQRRQAGPLTRRAGSARCAAGRRGGPARRPAGSPSAGPAGRRARS